MDNRPIGVFDSGVGGLSCVPALKKLLPKEQIIYIGDTARAPYGSRDTSEIVQFSLDIADRLIKLGCKSLSIACNTISCVAIPAIEEAYPDIPVIGIVRPAAGYIAKNCTGKRVGLIATQATVNSRAYPNAIKEYGGKMWFKSLATPDFVPMIEDGMASTREMDECIRKNLDLYVRDLDDIILGCTHFPFIEKNIKRLYPHLEIINPARCLAEQTRFVLIDRNIMSTDRAGANRYISTSDSYAFKRIAEKL